MTGESAKAHVGFLVAGACLAFLVVFLGACLHMRTTAQASPDPHDVAAERGCPVDWSFWKSVNPDVVGWITIAGTPVDYPVVQAHASDPTFYLSHDVYGRPNVYGCPYIDAACEAQGGTRAPCVVVFGHHMSDGTMFAAFANFAEEGYLLAHRTITLHTPASTRTLQAQAAAVVPGRQPSKRVEFASRVDLANFLLARTGASDVNVSDHDDVVRQSQAFAFVTCSYSRWSDERTVVYAW